MLQAFKLGADGVYIADCEEQTSPFPHSLKVVSENVSNTRAILQEQGIDEQRLRFADFSSADVEKFVSEMNKISEFVDRAGPIDKKMREELETNLKAKT